VSHDRFFLDKLCTKLLVFEGEGRIKEWVGSYTELREAQKAREQAEARGERKEKAAQAEEPRRKSPSNRMSFGEKRELQQLEKEVPALEKRKEEILARIAAGGGDHHATMELYIELERVVKDIDTKGERWLILTEKAEQEKAL
jgi:ATP-binding cassette subfamily F protein uup